MEINFWELCLVGTILLIIVLVSNASIYCLNRRLITRLALNCEREQSQIKLQVSSLQKAVTTQQNALLRLKRK